MKNQSKPIDGLRTSIIRSIFSKVSDDLLKSTSLLVIGIIIGIGSNLLTSLIGNQNALEQLQQLWRKIIETNQNTNPIIPTAVIALLGNILSFLTFSIIKKTERKKGK
jgi:hypothetical protein